ncbi:Ufc1 [Columba guinea]|nr:Ufc1 [Columba guinea]
MADEAARRAVAELPLLRTAAGPRDREGWAPRLKEEYRALIQYVENNKRADNDWFRLESNAEGTRWFGKCWYIHELLKYEFGIEFDIPVTYPATAPEIAIPELDGKTAKMYRLGGKICLSDHFKPLWARNVPKFGLAHLMALGLGPWLAVEIPDLVAKGIIQHKEKASPSAVPTMPQASEHRVGRTRDHAVVTSQPKAAAKLPSGHRALSQERHAAALASAAANGLSPAPKLRLLPPRPGALDDRGKKLELDRGRASKRGEALRSSACRRGPVKADHALSSGSLALRRSSSLRRVNISPGLDGKPTTPLLSIRPEGCLRTRAPNPPYAHSPDGPAPTSPPLGRAPVPGRTEEKVAAVRASGFVPSSSFACVG